MSQRWTDQEIVLLREYYPANGLNKTVSVLNRPVGSVKMKAISLGLKVEAGIYALDGEKFRCRVCKGKKLLGEFAFRKGTKTGREYVCKECSRARRRELYQANPERAARETLRKKCWRLGLSVAEYQRMLNSQHNRCALCGRSPLPGEKPLRIDHDHKTGKVRGLLCHPCNVGIGLLGDSPELLLRAAAYIKAGRL